MKRWYSDDESPIPTEVECEVSGYPNEDAEGRVQFENTHFDTAAEAWVNGRRSVEAWVSLAGRAVRMSQEKLRAAEREAGAASEEFARFVAAERKSGVSNG